MSAPKEMKRRSWGKTTHREITVINREKIEETLKTIAEETKKCQATSDESNRSVGIVDLQYPELMSNDSLITALKRIKVPIPVYSDGKPSRERLLYLYRMNVLPRPQRNGRGRARTGISWNPDRGDQGGVAMDVEQQNDWSVNGATRELQRKRKLPDDLDGETPAKKLSLNPSSFNSTGVTIPLTPSPTLGHTLSTLKLQDGSKQAMRLKRPPSSTTPSTSMDNDASVTSKSPCQDQIAAGPGAPKKACREKITWP